MKNLRNLRKISATAWTDGHEIFYFTVVDSAGNVTVQGLTSSDLTANRFVLTDANKKLISASDWFDQGVKVADSVEHAAITTYSINAVCHNDEVVCHNDEVVFG